jgi:lysophospholipase L1-like esterase
VKLRWTAALAATAVAAAAAGCSPGGGGEEAAGEHYYVSLGDSLAVGVQPGDEGPVETSEGYTDVLYRDLYGTDSGLRHERMGCSGEDTTTFTEGGLPDCAYAEGSQLRAAEAFLADHHGEVDLVTVGIGANNFTGCAQRDDGTVDTDVDTACVEDGLRRLEEEAPRIAERLRDAAGPDVEIVGMTYYNPFLAALLVEDVNEQISGGADGPEADEPSNRDLAAYSTEVLERANGTLVDAYTAEDIEVADVAAAFDSADTAVPEDSVTGMPANVQRICDYTYMCDTALGPDIHTNEAGAREIARVFRETVDAG